MVIPAIGMMLFSFRIYQNDPCVLEYHRCISANEIFQPLAAKIIGYGLLLPTNILIPFLYFRIYRIAIGMVNTQAIAAP